MDADDFERNEYVVMGEPEILSAAFCAPPSSFFDLASLSDDRPISSALPTFKPQRGTIRYRMP